ncbi:TRAP transporter small permease [Thalassospira marina]|uniref:TRAP transporter small permease protein n=1 Tax=Thalassospira marina TaxID=2048283 RepID=A0A2N3KWL0_9PROT|nr:TRAP transporter small permease [Thalassospira marina]AUG53771.1 C4-dicarboxylate ABC transporter permease [Thalassospira marina]PKR54918.1 C4-dicarboxylate ABC transporter permease [Thalassospira marina]
MRKSLDILFGITSILAAVFLVMIALLILSQSIGRLLGHVIPDANELAGFSLAAGMFLALGPSLRQGSHIRVLLVVGHISGVPRRIMDLITLGFAVFLAGYFTWWMGVLAEESFSYGDASAGVLAFPLWIPQAAMTFGLAMLTLALVEGLIDTLRGQATVFADRETSDMTE